MYLVRSGQTGPFSVQSSSPGSTVQQLLSATVIPTKLVLLKKSQKRLEKI